MACSLLGDSLTDVPPLRQEAHSLKIGAYTIVADYHTHTKHSHGKGSVLDNVRAASLLGLKEIGITDHGPANLFGVGVESFATFDVIRQEVARAQELYPDVRVLLGVEANVVSEEGEIDVPLELQETLDIVLVGLHPLVRWKPPSSGVSLVGLNLVSAWTGRNRERARERNTRAIVNAVLRNRVHVVTHPGYRLPIDTRALAQACAKTGCAMEINAGHDHTTVEYIRIAHDQGARFVLGSDAHSPERVGDLAKAALLAQRAGLGADAIVNVAS